MSESQTLQLGGIIPSLEEDVEAYEHLDKRAMAYLDKIGVKLPEQPMLDGKPLIPSIPIGPNGPSLDSLDERGLSNLQVSLVSYYQYVSTQLGILDIKKEAIKEKLDLTEAKVMLLLPPPETSKKTRAKTDIRVKKLKDKYLEAKAVFTLLSKVVASVESELKIVSREVTIRQEEQNADRRSDNIKRGPFKREGLPGGRRVG